MPKNRSEEYTGGSDVDFFAVLDENNKIDKLPLQLRFAYTTLSGAGGCVGVFGCGWVWIVWVVGGVWLLCAVGVVSCGLGVGWV